MVWYGENERVTGYFLRFTQRKVQYVFISWIREKGKAEESGGWEEQGLSGEGRGKLWKEGGK